MWVLVAMSLLAEGGAPEHPPPPSPRWRVLLDAGHGAPDNRGAELVRCEDEADVMLRITRDVARALAASGPFEVAVTRTASVGPPYPERLAAIDRFGAQAFVSLHADTRGEVHLWSPTPGRRCRRNDGQPGIAVLWSDDGAAGLVSARRALADRVARALSAAELPLYDGEDYAGLFVPGAVAGTFIDRRGLMMLRRPRVPSLIVETHHGLSLPDSERWADPATAERFARALAEGLEAFFRAADIAPRVGRPVEAPEHDSPVGSGRSGG